MRGEHDIQVRWTPFELNPRMAREGMSRQEYRQKKFGSAKAVEEMDRRMNAVGAQEGIPFALDRIARSPNTFDAHRLAWFAGRHGVQDRVAQALLRAFFTEGRDIGDRAVLAEIGAEAGLDRDTVRAFLEGEEGSREVREEEQRVRDLGVDAVPFFIVGGKFALSGAQEAEVFLEAFRELYNGRS